MSFDRLFNKKRRPGLSIETFQKNKLGRLIETGRSFIKPYKNEIVLVV